MDHTVKGRNDYKLRLLSNRGQPCPGCSDCSASYHRFLQRKQNPRCPAVFEYGKGNYCIMWGTTKTHRLCKAQYQRRGKDGLRQGTRRDKNSRQRAQKQQWINYLQAEELDGRHKLVFAHILGIHYLFGRDRACLPERWSLLFKSQVISTRQISRTVRCPY